MRWSITNHVHIYPSICGHTDIHKSAMLQYRTFCITFTVTFFFSSVRRGVFLEATKKLRCKQFLSSADRGDQSREKSAQEYIIRSLFHWISSSLPHRVVRSPFLSADDTNAKILTPRKLFRPPVFLFSILSSLERKCLALLCGGNSILIRIRDETEGFFICRPIINSSADWDWSEHVLSRCCSCTQVHANRSSGFCSPADCATWIMHLIKCAQRIYSLNSLHTQSTHNLLCNCLSDCTISLLVELSYRKSFKRRATDVVVESLRLFIFILCTLRELFQLVDVRWLCKQRLWAWKHNAKEVCPRKQWLSWWGG